MRVDVKSHSSQVCYCLCCYCCYCFRTGDSQKRGFSMGEDTGLRHLQLVLRSLCFSTEWKYAVFWKLKHRTRMILTWEDAYYNNYEPTDCSNHMPLHDKLKNLPDGYSLQDALGLAVAKMSYLVYSLGEGIIGQVAVTGKHQWIFADKLSSCSWSSSEYCDGWQSQFSAGIKTIAVVAVVPLGVVQLGSLNTVSEDMKVVTHIKEIFCLLQNSSMEFIPNSLKYSMHSSSFLSEVSSQDSGLEIFNDSPHYSDKSLSKRCSYIEPCLFPSLGTFNNISHSVYQPLHLHPKKQFEKLNEHVIFESLKVGNNESAKIHKLKSAMPILNREKEVLKNLVDKEKCGGENGNWSDSFDVIKHINASDPCVLAADNKMQQVDNKFGVDYSFFPLDPLDSTVCGSVKFDSTDYEKLELSDQFKMQLDNGPKEKSDTEVSCIDSSGTFSAGCELYEALGSAFKKELTNGTWRPSDKTEASSHNETLNRMANSHFMASLGSDYLLEAVVANAVSASSNIISRNSLCKSAESVLTTGRTEESLHHARHGGSFSSKSFIHSSNVVKDDTYHQLKSVLDSREVSVVRSSTESSLNSLNRHSKQSDLQSGPAKINRKRARPGESCRPRPRDRQLIQDRVKELRELVPNGSKCSIDSLLERTIKHMLFLQGVTKHADKLKIYPESKFDDSMNTVGSCSKEHGSNWSQDVESQTEACPIVVDNLNMSGQMLVEMQEECCHFLEIAEVIRSLGLTILKGVTKVHGEKTWASFVVEGQHDRGMHRMDILWSLMRLLQPKIIA